MVNMDKGQKELFIWWSIQETNAASQESQGPI